MWKKVNIEDKKEKKWRRVCNRINNGEIFAFRKNFLSEEILGAVKESYSQQHESGKGILEIDRLFNNLLSSQPLAFNFFGFMKYHRDDIALGFLKTYNAEITAIDDVVFEFAPGSSKDNSAFDVGFKVSAGVQKGFIGFEVKYTDKFSYRRNDKKKTFYGDVGDKNHDIYHKLYTEHTHRFPDDYYSYVRAKNFNQLFRNEILGVQLLNEYDFIQTGLFCHHDDKKTIEAGHEFIKKIGNQTDDFIVVTYADYFERMQKIDLPWEYRELVMTLWARYCGLNLSEKVRMSL